MLETKWTKGTAFKFRVLVPVEEKGGRGTMICRLFIALERLQGHLHPLDIFGTLFNLPEEESCSFLTQTEEKFKRAVH